MYGPPYLVQEVSKVRLNGKMVEQVETVLRSNDIYICLRRLRRAGNAARLVRLKDGAKLAFNKWSSTPPPDNTIKR